MSLLNHHAWKHLRWLPWIGAVALLALPLLAMQFSPEVNWTGFDFLVMGTLLALACGAFELALRAAPNSTYMLAAAIALGAGFLMTWVNLAVGIIGDEHERLNLMFFAVLGMGLVGAAWARLRPRPMAIVMLAMAIVQGIATVVTALLGSGFVFVLAALFALAWLASAWLFRLSARQG